MKRAPLALAALICVLAVGPGVASADYYATSAYTVVTGSAIPSTGVLVYTGKTTLGGATAWNATGVTAYLGIYDTTTTPNTGDIPAWQSPACGAVVCQVSPPAGGVKLLVGAFAAYSKTGPSFTAPTFGSAGFYTVARK